MKTSQTVLLCVLLFLTLETRQGVLAQSNTVSSLASAAAVNAMLSSDRVKSEPLALALFADEKQAGNDEWRFDFISWIWLTGIEGDVGAHGRSASVDVSFGDLLDASDSLIGLAGRIEFGKGKWSGFVEGLYDKIEDEGATGPLGLSNVDVTLELGIIDFGVMYRVGEWRVERISADSMHKDVTLDAYAGARFTTVSMEINPANLPPEDRNKNWIDPIVGAKLVVPISDKFQFSVWGDVGGFGVSSDFTWSATGVFSYDFPLFGLRATVYAGYRAIGDDYSDGSGADKFVWDITLHGPIIGLDIRF